MIILKRVLIIFAALIIAILIFAAFVPKQFSVERKITINKSKKEVFDYIKYLKNQDNFSVWAKIDPEMAKTYQGIDGTVGFISSWNSNNGDVGRGEQEIINIVEGKRIDFELRFIEPFESVSPAHMITEETSTGKTIVVWGFDGEMPYPMNIMLVFGDMEENLGNDLQEGLINLKKELEKKGREIL